MTMLAVLALLLASVGYFGSIPSLGLPDSERDGGLQADTVLTSITVNVAPTTSSVPVLDLSSLTFAEADDFVTGLSEGASIEVPFAGIPGLADLSVTVGVAVEPTAESIVFVGTATLDGGLNVDAMLLAQWNGNATPDLVIGIKRPNLALADLGFSGPLTDYAFPEAVFPVVIPANGANVSLASTALPVEAVSFLDAAVPGTTGFTLELQSGINFTSGLPFSALPTGLTDAIGVAPTDVVLISGTIGVDFGIVNGTPSVGLDGLALEVVLPDLLPTVIPGWLVPTPGIPNVLSLTHQGGSTQAGFIGSVDALLDGQVLPFVISAELDFTAGSTDFVLQAANHSGWDQPFGVTWLTLDAIGLTLTASGTGELGATLESTFQAAGHNFSVTIDITGTGSGVEATFTLSTADTFALSDVPPLIKIFFPAVTIPTLPDPRAELTGLTISVSSGDALSRHHRRDDIRWSGWPGPLLRHRPRRRTGVPLRHQRLVMEHVQPRADAP